MTLVLPFGGEQLCVGKKAMPCVFDSDSAFDRDFESELLADWTTDISDYEMTVQDSAIKPPSDPSELKRKGCEGVESPAKKARGGEEEAASSSSSEDPSSSSQEEEEEFPPRRRVPQMWNSRQRWKDERKKVLKMSIAKLSEIEDPELCLGRSVRINNTIRRLHADIRADRSAKLRQRQSRDTFFGFAPQPDCDRRVSSPLPDFDATPMDVGDDDKPDSCDYDACATPAAATPAAGATLPPEASPSSFASESSAAFTAAATPSPTFAATATPSATFTTPPSAAFTAAATPSPTFVATATPSPTFSATATPSATFTASPFTTTSSVTTTSLTSSSLEAKPTYTNSDSWRRSSTSVPAFPSSQCATQYRTHAGQPETSFPPRVPILDSVVYHSLLASLESS